MFSTVVFPDCQKVCELRESELEIFRLSIEYPQDSLFDDRDEASCARRLCTCPRSRYVFIASRRSVASTSRMGKSRDWASKLGFTEGETAPDIRFRVTYSPSILFSAEKK